MDVAGRAVAPIELERQSGGTPEAAGGGAQGLFHFTRHAKEGLTFCLCRRKRFTTALALRCGGST